MPFVYGLLVGLALSFVWHRVRRAAASTQQPGGQPAPPAVSSEDSAENPEDSAEGDNDDEAREVPAPQDPRARLHWYAEELQLFYNQASSPEDLTAHPGFIAATELLASDAFAAAELWRYLRGDNSVLTTLAAMAFVERPTAPGEDFVTPALASLNEPNFYARSFLLRALEEHAPGPLVAPVLGRADGSWAATSFAGRLLGEFVVRRLRAGDTELPEDALVKQSAEQLEWLAQLVDELETPEPGTTALATQLRASARGRIDIEFLHGIGRFLSPGQAEGLVVDEHFAAHVDAVHELLVRGTARSLALVGEAGVGKSATLQLVAARLLQEGWRIFVTSTSELLAGQSHIGELEERMRRLLHNLGDKPKLLWFVPDFDETALAGRHRFSNVSVLDILMPALETGRVRVLAELEPAAWERLAQQRPVLRHAMHIERLAPLDESATLSLARRYAEHVTPAGAAPLLGEELLRRSLQLVGQFLGERAQPGSLLGFLDTARRQRASASGQDDVVLSLDDVLSTLARLTGLPRVVLDDRELLDLAAAERHFHARVIGQPEAVTCLVERIAMIKAGLCDPTRPLGVFLFTGPTGTGKTELAKSLAEWLFGAPERMIRLDMSELQDHASLDRLLGEGGDVHGSAQKTALVHEIRKEPFSVVLLDEFEKAHPVVQDLFLQVFDDGRLSDRHGRVADFRHAIVILTSNVGAAATRGAGMGFAETSSALGLDAGVEKALRQEFRVEFLNRLDRIVIFRALGRAEMHRVLEKELRLVLERRGLRHRQWAVEWDPSALEFFLDRGFTAELGARPLRRSIERHLLAPLARTIVHQKAPSGDQFLFVRSNGSRIDVEFVDPDADEGAGARAATASEVAALSLGRIALEPAGTAAEVELLLRTHAELGEQLAAPAWSERKQAAFAAMAEPEFWTREDRFGVLADAEYRERIEVGMATAERLVRRLRGPGGEQRAQFAPEVVGRLAEQLHLLDAALRGLERERPTDAFVRVEALHDPRQDEAATDTFAREVGAMYRQWAQKRRMQSETLLELGEAGRTPYQLILAVGGYGAYSLLEHERGLHVLEHRTGDGVDGVRRLRVRVTVAGQPERPPREQASERIRLARAELDAVPLDPAQIARRYRREPSPLVRDAARGWRTGRLDRVLAGDFDLIA